VLGYLAILESGDSDSGLDLFVAQHAATVCALALMRDDIEAQVLARLQDELLDSLLSGELNEQAAAERASHLGLATGRPYRALVFAPEEMQCGTPSQDVTSPARLASRRRTLEALASLVTSRAPGAVASIRGDHLVVVLPEGRDATTSVRERSAPPPSAASLGQAAVLHVATLVSAWRLRVGIGAHCEVVDLSRSYAEARHAAEIARRYASLGDVVAFEDLGFYRLLHQVKDASELRAYVDQTIGSLVAYDRKHKAEFVQTLAAYLANNTSVQNTARALTLHVNTVAYRLQRIRVISGLELDNAEHRFRAQVALAILDILPS
jgi:sugar diacid utilization regulator